VLGKIGQAAAGKQLHGRHGTRSPAVYMDMQQQGKTAIVTGVPKLTIENVWILVYGLGAVVFIMSYTCLGVQPISLTCMGVGMGVLGADELIPLMAYVLVRARPERLASLLALVEGYLSSQPGLLLGVLGFGLATRGGRGSRFGDRFSRRVCVCVGLGDSFFSHAYLPRMPSKISPNDGLLWWLITDLAASITKGMG
jgi:hypothetical protein